MGAVNIGVPFIAFVVAAAAVFPVGGATVVAIRMGRGDKEGAIDKGIEEQIAAIWGRWVIEYGCLHYGEGCYP